MRRAETSGTVGDSSLYPELRMWATVLEQAVADFLRGKGDDQSDAEHWIFFSRDESQFNTFMNLCYTLDLDPDAVRDRLKRMRGHQMIDPLDKKSAQRAELGTCAEGPQIPHAETADCLGYWKPATPEEV